MNDDKNFESGVQIVPHAECDAAIVGLQITDYLADGVSNSGSLLGSEMVKVIMFGPNTQKQERIDITQKIIKTIFYTSVITAYNFRAPND